MGRTVAMFKMVTPTLGIKQQLRPAKPLQSVTFNLITTIQTNWVKAIIHMEKNNKKKHAQPGQGIITK